jgi:hypothetical protein
VTPSESPRPPWTCGKRMTPNHPYGQTEPAPVYVLPELAFDLSEGQPLSATLGQTEVPVVVLPELAFDMSATEPVPSLQITLSLRTGAAPGQVALDLLRLYAAVNQLELSQHGAGLIPDAAAWDSTANDGTMRVTFRPADPNGAALRLANVVSAMSDALKFPSIVRCEAKVA